jgi:ribosome-binding protein aMBF1 (putative translation factor)
MEQTKNVLAHGGKREGAGRKPTGRRGRYIYVTDEEYTLVRQYIKLIREERRNG